MKKSPMHISNILFAKIGNILNKFVPMKTNSLPQLAEYSLIKDFTPPYKTIKNRVGLYKDKKNQKIIIKQVPYGIKNMEAVYSQNEAFTLQTITRVADANTVAPKFIAAFAAPHVVGFASEYFEGKNVE